MVKLICSNHDCRSEIGKGGQNLTVRHDVDRGCRNLPLKHMPLWSYNV